MPSIETEARSLRARALVVRKLCHTSAVTAGKEWDTAAREESFWLGLGSLADEFVSFLERLPKILPASLLNLDMPPEGSPRYDEKGVHE